MRRFNKLAFLIAAAVVGGAALGLYAQTVSLSPQDMRAAEAEYSDLAAGGNHGHSANLHSADTFPDGARGYIVGTIPEHILPEPPFKTEDEQVFHYRYCGAATIVVARELSAQSILSTKKDMIFTLYQFLVTDSLKSSPDASVGQQIAVIRFGGELMDDGELLRAQYMGQIPFKPNQSYLLVLRRNAQNPSFAFFANNSETIPVANGRIYPPDQPTDPPTPNTAKWGPFLSGELVADIKERLPEIVALAPCGK